MQVTKRDGSKQDFDKFKILGAIRAAMEEVLGKSFSSEQLMTEVNEAIFAEVGEDGVITIEQIQDHVEIVLMLNFPAVAKAYILYRERHANLRVLEPDVAAIADYIHASKYAKYLPDKKRRETFSETVRRSEMMHIKKFPELEIQIAEAFSFVQSKKVLPSMRSMQFGGEAVRQHNARMYNCSFTLVDRVRSFQEIFYLLLCGCGVGFSVQSQHVDKLPKIGEPNTQRVLSHTIKDSIIGWADTVGLLFNSYQQELYFEPSYQLIRPEGSVLKTGGGRAPGHLPLKRLIEKLRLILDEAIGRRLRSIECHDIICHIAEAVLAGGIRRSSLISLFSKNDDEMLHAKTPEHFDYNGLNSQRAMANNSVVLLRNSTSEQEFMDVMNLNRKSFGEPGFVFTNNLDHGTNPCGEIGINPTMLSNVALGSSGPMESLTGFGFCNLCEINVAACKTAKDFYEAAKAASFIGTLQASYTDIPYLGDATKHIIERDALLGVGLVGIMDNPKIGLDRQTLVLGAGIVKDENRRVADLIKIGYAARCTTVKPSGTSSLELGCVGSGIHPHHADRYFRRVTANINEPVAQHFMSINPHMVETKPDGDLCITFPVKAPKNAIKLGDLGALVFMSSIFDVYDWWINTGTVRGKLTHNISSTVVVGEDEWDEVLACAWMNRNKIRSMSFFPSHGDKGIPFAPREKVETQDEARWKHLVENYKPIDYLKMIEEKDVTTRMRETACAGSACELIHSEVATPADGSMFFTEPPTTEFWIFDTTLKEIGGIRVWQGWYSKPQSGGAMG